MTRYEFNLLIGTLVGATIGIFIGAYVILPRTDTATGIVLSALAFIVGMLIGQRLMIQAQR